ncbi:MAG: geranylgeranyl reductase family protein [bacterium]
MSIRYDAIVVGTGPAGAVAAEALGRAGRRTLLIERERLPRPKTCGGGVTWKAARALGVDLTPLAERTIGTVDLHWRLKASTTMPVGQPLVHMFQRSRFDAWLVERALATGQVELKDGLSVKSVEATDGGVVVRTTQDTFEADYLVGADGAAGPVARSLGLMQERHLLPATEQDIAVDAKTMDRWQDRMALDIGTLHGSYGWVFPKDDHLNVGVGCFSTNSRPAKQLKDYGKRHLAYQLPGPMRVLRTVGFVLPLRPVGAPIQKGRALLAGDAAGLVEAFTGEGIHWALRSGQIAAQAIVDHQFSGARGELGYEARIDAELMPTLLDARRWAHIYLWMPRACYTLPARSPRFWGAVAKIVRGERDYTDVRRRLGAFGRVADWLPVEMG